MLRRRTLQSVVLAVAATLISGTGGRLPLAAERAIAGITIDELRTHVQVLASDELAGRGVGHAGNARAETYVAEAIRRAGAQPVSDHAYLQPVAVYQPVIGSEGRLTIAEGEQRLLDALPGDDFYPFPESAAGTTAARLVFAGHGISAPRDGHDDFSGRDVRGAILLVLDSAPARLGQRGEDFFSAARKARDAAAHGAAGLIILTPRPEGTRTLWPDESSVRAAPYRLYSEVQKSGLPVVALSDRAADPIRRALESGRQLTATVNSGVICRPVTIHNVLGMVEGRDGARDELVVVGAHLDHDGVDAAGRIYNGADDNASGTAAVIAMSGAFARAAVDGERARRAVLFALWNGEEKGSLGAEAYLDAPLPPRRIVANINLDMIGRAEHVPDPTDPRFYGFDRSSPAQTGNVLHLLGYSYSPDLAAIVNAANRDIGLTIRQGYDEGAQGLLRRSDNWPFLRRGIPAVFLTTGLHPDYHTPDDDIERLDFGKLERITRLAARAAWLAADGPAPRMRK